MMNARSIIVNLVKLDRHRRMLGGAGLPCSLKALLEARPHVEPMDI